MFSLFILILILSSNHLVISPIPPSSPFPPGTVGIPLTLAFPFSETVFFISNAVIFPYVDTLHTDSWLTSSYCWTPWCLEVASQGNPKYKGKLSTFHQSNGTIVLLDSYNQSKVLGLQITDTIHFGYHGRFFTFSNTSWVEGYEIIKTPDTLGATALLGLGTIYGLQTTLTPFIYQLVVNGDISEPVFTFDYCINSNYNDDLVVGAPIDGDWSAIMGDNVVPNVPIAARDGTWNLIAKDLALNDTALGFNGLAVIDALNPNLTFPRTVASILGNLLGANSFTIDNVDYYYYNTPCVDSSSLPWLNITLQTGTLPILPMYYYGGSSSSLPPCYLNITGKDIFTSSGNPIWSLGVPLLMGYATTFNNTIGLETINFNQSLC